jgi:hypothetical protein
MGVLGNLQVRADSWLDHTKNQEKSNQRTMNQRNDLAILKLYEYASLKLITAFSRKEKAFFFVKRSVIIQLKLKGSVSYIQQLSDP